MEANGSGSSSDSAPDCWDQADLEPSSGSNAAAAAVDEETAAAAAGPGAAQLESEEEQLLGAAFSRHLNVNAKPFVPNVHAAEFVPAFLRSGPGQPAPPPPPSPPPGLPPPPPPSLTHGELTEPPDTGKGILPSGAD
ncbi:eukaryotic peptide chain release factor GTP-binding subunit ERF3A-like [Erythrolamprus reginae]|uniref:eukaryotic peptide chain release factor GTP-binding subunit ERF3A-like n=1 Tax=Erythrolamprus reginae TaxID=121349 RepID=UPI00396CFEB7